MNLSIEPAATALSSRQLEVGQLLYSTRTCFIYQVTDQKYQRPAALKLCIFPLSGDPDLAMREVSNLQKCRHPNIVELYDSFWFYLNPQYWVSAIEMELMVSDLAKSNSNRSKNRYPWTEDELYEFLKAMISALAHAQDLNIAHRDIKPQNIFYQHETFKIGDFGSSKELDGTTIMNTVAGTDAYMSPILRAVRNEKYLVHNPYKSDMFSLGLTLLTMATLTPQSPFIDLEASLSACIESIQYSDNMKSWLRWMLVTEERNRPDFLMVRDYMNKVESGIAPESASEPEVETTCEHIKNNPSLPALVPKCGHKMCSLCAITQSQSLRRLLLVFCSLCKETFEYRFADQQSFNHANPQFLSPIDPPPFNPSNLQSLRPIDPQSLSPTYLQSPNYTDLQSPDSTELQSPSPTEVLPPKVLSPKVLSPKALSPKVPSPEPEFCSFCNQPGELVYINEGGIEGKHCKECATNAYCQLEYQSRQAFQRPKKLYI